MRGVANVLRWLKLAPPEEDGETLEIKERARRETDERLREARLRRERDLKAARAALKARDSDEPFTLDGFLAAIRANAERGEVTKGEDTKRGI